jgi:hypothetical protein
MGRDCPFVAGDGTRVECGASENLRESEDVEYRLLLRGTLALSLLTYAL